MKYILVIVVASLFIGDSVFAQKSRPWGIITQQERSSVLQSSLLIRLLPGIMNSGLQTIPTGNSSSNDRRVRATIAKNAAMSAYIAHTVNGNNIQPLSPQEQQVFSNQALSILRNCNTTIPQLSITSPNAYEDWQWRSKEFIDLLSAYDILRGIPSIDRQTLDSIEIRLAQFAILFHREATKSILGLTFFGMIKNNHALMTAAAIGMSGVILADFKSMIPEDKPDWWLATALGAIDDIMWKSENAQSNSDGTAGYSEGPHYYRYAMLNMLPMFRAMYHYYPDTNFTTQYGAVQHPYYDKRFRACSQWLISLLQPDGTYPALGDTFFGSGFPELALLGDEELVYPFSDNELSAQLQSTVDMRANYVAAQTYAGYKAHKGLSVNTNAGSAVMHTPQWYAHYNAKNGNIRTSGSGHSQSDMASFLIWNNGRPMILDPGYLQYGMRDQVGNAQQHNTILVNGQGPPNGSPLQPGGADAFITHAFSIPSIEYVEIQTSYNNAALTRSFINVHDSFLVNADHCQSQTPAVFTHLLHGNGLINGNEQTGLAYWQNMGTLTTMKWERDSAHIDAFYSSSKLAGFTIDSSVHEEGYMKPGYHTVLQTQSKPSTSAAFIGFISPSQRNSSSSQLPSLVFRDTSCTALSMDYANKSGCVIAVKHDTLLHQIEAFSNKDVGFFAETDAQNAMVWQGEGYYDFSLIMTNGTVFRDAETQIAIVQSNQRTTMGISAIEQGFEGYFGASGTLKHALISLIPYAEANGLKVIDVKGSIASWGQDSIVFTQPGKFTIIIGKPSLIHEQEQEIFTVHHYGNSVLVNINQSTHSTVEIVDIMGNRIAKKGYNPDTEKSVSFDISGLTSGIYWVLFEGYGKKLIIIQ